MEEEKPSKQINISNRILCSPHNLPVRSMCDKYYCSWHLMVAKHFECLSVAKWTRSMQITSGILTKMVLHCVLIRCAFIMGCECSRQMCFATGNVCNVPLWLIKNRKFEAAFSYKWLAPSIGRLVWSKCGSMDPALDGRIFNLWLLLLQRIRVTVQSDSYSHPPTYSSTNSVVWTQSNRIWSFLCKIIVYHFNWIYVSTIASGNNFQ